MIVSELLKMKRKNQLLAKNRYVELDEMQKLWR